VSSAAALERVRAICLALPEVVERSSHDAPSFFVGGKRCFAMFMDNHHGDGRLASSCAAADGLQQALISGSPAAYFRPPYVGHRGWVGVHVDREAAWEEIAGVLEDAWACVAPGRLVERVE
jgi:hypothetical protein